MGMSEKTKTRAAIYARVSTNDQNPEAQLLALRNYVEQRGFVLYKEYVDHVTGDFTKRGKKRRAKDKAYEELMADVAKRLVDCVIVWKYDRFARSLSVLVTALEHFNKLGVDFISYTQNIDTTTPMGRLFYNVIGSFAEFERETIVERVIAGLANARAKGVRLGRPEKDPTAAERITTLREEGLSLRQIAVKEKLSAAGVLKILRRSKDNDNKSLLLAPVELTLDVDIEREIVQKSIPKSAPLETPEIYQFRVVICDVSPLIWRRVLVRSDSTLEQLSTVIHALFDWGGDHLHKFMVPSPFGRGLEIDESSADKPLSVMGLQLGDCLLYEYDFGDSWIHEIVLEKVTKFSKQRRYPVCTAGKNAGPPEDCGGPYAYMNARNFLSRRKGKPAKAPRGRVSVFEKEFYRENYKGFDPDKFDREEVNQQLAELESEAL